MAENVWEFVQEHLADADDGEDVVVVVPHPSRPGWVHVATWTPCGEDLQFLRGADGMGRAAYYVHLAAMLRDRLAVEDLES